MEVTQVASDAQARHQIGDADAFFGKITPPLLSAASQLRWIQAPTASLEHYLFPELVDHPAVLTNMRGLYYDVVADHSFGLIIALARHFDRYMRQQQAGIWAAVGGEEERSDFIRGPGTTNAIDRAHQDLSASTLGIVGLGSIGRAIAQRANVFGMRILAVDPKCDQSVAGIENIRPPGEIDDVLGQCDFVVIAAPHTPDTQKLFCRARFRHMKRSAYLINVGRGAIVDLADLEDALRNQVIAGAALDVCEIEPLPADHPLWRMDGVIITPHVAGYSVKIAERHLQVLLQNIARFRRGEPLLNVVDKRRWY